MSYQDYPASTTNSVNLSSRKKRRGMIEKKRRDKINQSLSELRRLVPAAFEKEGSAKLEKAEILQMTVDYLRELHERGLAGSLTTRIKPETEQVVETPSSTPISASSLMLSQQANHHQAQQHLSHSANSHQPSRAIHPTSPHETTIQTSTTSASMTASMTAAAAAAAAAVQHQQNQLHHHLTQTHQVAVAAQQHHNQIQQFNYGHHNHHHPDLAQSPILEQFYSHHQNAGHHHQRTTMQQLHHQPYAANCYNPTY